MCPALIVMKTHCQPNGSQSGLPTGWKKEKTSVESPAPTEIIRRLRMSGSRKAVPESMKPAWPKISDSVIFRPPGSDRLWRIQSPNRSKASARPVGAAVERSLGVVAKSGTRVGSRSKALGVEGSREVAEGKDLAKRASGLTGRHMLVVASPQPGQAGADTRRVWSSRCLDCLGGRLFDLSWISEQHSERVLSPIFGSYEGRRTIPPISSRS